MSDSTRESLLQEGREAASRGDWPAAHRALAEVDAGSPLGGPELALLAEVAYAAGHLDVTIEAWERAHEESERAGNPLAAAGAAVRVAMHLLFDTALMAPVRGWLGRAERLLARQPEAGTPVHAWLAVVRSYERMLAGDFPATRVWARQAIDVGSTCDPAAATIGRVAEARGFILAGDVRQGLALLEEAGVAMVSGEIDPLSTGVVYCELVCALQALAQYDLAEEWTQAMERWRRRSGIGSIHGRCRVHRAEILRLRGSYDRAEEEALRACEELRPWLRRELGWPLNELGRIRLQKGDLRGAEDAFLAAHDLGWDPSPGVALVRLARGDVAQAVASIRDALAHPMNVPSKELPPNSELRRAPLLAAQVEIELAAGHHDRARAAAEELEQVAARFESKALIATAALAQGRVRVVAGDTAGARRAFEAAARVFDEVGAPYETALARMGLADVYRAEQDEPGALLELRAAGATFARIGARPLAERASLAGGGSGAEAVRAVPQPGPMTASKVPATAPATTEVRERELAASHQNVFCREGDYWSVAFDGRVVRLRDRKGLRYLARLLADPGRAFHVLDLVALETRTHDAAPALRDMGAMLDARAKAAYRRRLAEIEEDVGEARALGDPERAARAELEREFLVRELARAVGLGGRDRLAGAASERARVSVTRALRQALARIREHAPLLGQHLDRAVSTGTYCAYTPDPLSPLVWNPGTRAEAVMVPDGAPGSRA
jgi:tetratricopeptide (TPR) repeat protein